MAALQMQVRAPRWPAAASFSKLACCIAGAAWHHCCWHSSVFVRSRGVWHKLTAQTITHTTRPSTAPRWAPIPRRSPPPASASSRARCTARGRATSGARTSARGASRRRPLLACAACTQATLCAQRCVSCYFCAQQNRCDRQQLPTSASPLQALFESRQMLNSNVLKISNDTSNVLKIHPQVQGAV